MNTIARDLPRNLSGTSATSTGTPAAPLGARIEHVAEHATRLSVVTVLGWIGALKFTAYEAGAIEGVSTRPF